MNFPLINHPTRGTPDVMVTLALLVTLAATLRFILDGVSLTIAGHTLAFGHIDSMTYGALLTPVLGGHVISESQQMPAKPKAENPGL